MKHTALAAGLFILLLQLYMYINAPALFGSNAPKVQDIIMAYIVLFTSVVVYTHFIPSELNVPWFAAIRSFLIGFVLTSLVLIAFRFLHIDAIIKYSIMHLPLAISSAAVAAVALNLFVVAYTEEAVFRGILPRYVGPIMAQVLFGLFHMAVYNISIPAMLVAMLFGYIFYIIKMKMDIWTSMGVHAALNLAAVGALYALWGVAV